MTKSLSLQEVIDEIHQSILATPKRQRKLLSKTFWDRFGFKVRTKERVEEVRNGLHERQIIINIDPDRFGTEGKKEWIILTYLASTPPSIEASLPDAESMIPFPPDAWFELLISREYGSEREVELYFIMPIIKHLDYSETDCAWDWPVPMWQGGKKVPTRADLVLFNGKSRSNGDAMLVFEAKRPLGELTEDAVGQARSYAHALATPYYAVTNGIELRVYVHGSGVQADSMKLSVGRTELKSSWGELFALLNRRAVLEHKERRARLFQDVL